MDGKQKIKGGNDEEDGKQRENKKEINGLEKEKGK